MAFFKRNKKTEKAPAPAPVVPTFADAPTFGIDISGATADVRRDHGRQTMIPGPGR